MSFDENAYWRPMFVASLCCDLDYQYMGAELNAVFFSNFAKCELQFVNVILQFAIR